MYQCVLFVANTEKMYKMLIEQSLKSSKQRATLNNISYIEAVNPERARESIIDIREEDAENKN